MSTASGNKLFLMIVPILGIVLAYFGMPHTERLPENIIEKLPYAPYLIFIGGTFLGGFFKRHRIAFISFTYGLAYLVLHNSGYTDALNSNAHQALIVTMTAFLLPLNVALLSSLKEQQVLSIQGLMASIIILGQFVVSYWLLQNYSALLEQYLFFQVEQLSPYIPSTISLAVSISFLISFIVLTVHVIKTKGLFEIAFLGCLLSSLFFFATGLEKPSDTIYISLAGLILVWGLMHNSYVIAYIDELTELPGRRAMNEELSRLRGQYSIAMLDIDFFKKFNDTYGHDVGDQVLRMVASKINQIGGGGKPFRYGGEEFSIIFPGKDSKATFPFLSNLRETIDDTSLILRNQDRPAKKPEKIPPKKVPWQEVHVTISIGVATTCDELRTTEEVMKAADEALYRSKEKGRNRISQYSTKDYVPDVSDEEGAIE